MLTYQLLPFGDPPPHGNSIHGLGVSHLHVHILCGHIDSCKPLGCVAILMIVTCLALHLLSPQQMALLYAWLLLLLPIGVCYDLVLPSWRQNLVSGRILSHVSCQTSPTYTQKRPISHCGDCLEQFIGLPRSGSTDFLVHSLCTSRCALLRALVYSPRNLGWSTKCQPVVRCFVASDLLLCLAGCIPSQDGNIGPLQVCPRSRYDYLSALAHWCETPLYCCILAQTQYSHSSQHFAAG